MVELNLRKMLIQATPKSAQDLVVISMPNDPGIGMLANACQGSKICYVSFSSKLSEVAEKNFKKTGINNVQVGNLVEIGHGNVDCIYFNCYFDFCESEEIPRSIALAAAVLKKDGLLFSAHVAEPNRRSEKFWEKLFSIFSGLSRECHPVILNEYLAEYFDVTKQKRIFQFGFPIDYLIALKK